jgi:hypothetical protein
MATYKATSRGYIGRVVEAGETFEFDGPKGSWMESVESTKSTKSAEPEKEVKDEKTKDNKRG